ncbi:hypothetical protein C8F04DRAFT_1248205 [Mycena alexandri]|uniref:Uncharacterized protein n=1 Tax=Mycena alexandri TaxID=1745969 RepID=A0AAD6XGG5_9AGAR|nr:hypothetical protein C8F04DRAFT_1248205 [Mycena alexandri]
MLSSTLCASSSLAHSGLASLTTMFLVILASPFFSKSHPEDDLCTAYTPSFTSATPTSVVLQQKDYGFFTKCLLVIVCFGITIASGYWARSSGSGRLKRQENQHPPPPPSPQPPPPQQPFVNQNAADDDEAHNGNGDDGDDEPHEGAGEDEHSAPAGDGHATAAAPAPEDPPPPGGLEEDDDDNDGGEYFMDGGLAWLVLLLIGSLIISVGKREWSNGSADTNLKHVDAVKTPSATIPSLLKRQMTVAIEDLACGASKAPSLIQGLLQRRPQPTLFTTGQLHDAVTLDPAAPAVSSAVSSITSVARKASRIFAWRDVYFLSAVLPGLAFFVTALRLLLPLRANNRDGEQLAALQLALVGEREEEEDGPGPEPEPPATPRQLQNPRTAPPSPVSPRRQRPLTPLPFRDATTQETCGRMLGVIRRATALRMVRAEAAIPEREEMRKERVREVQRRIWGCPTMSTSGF